MIPDFVSDAISQASNNEIVCWVVVSLLGAVVLKKLLGVVLGFALPSS
jgi:hypothetical protein